MFGPSAPRSTNPFASAQAAPASCCGVQISVCEATGLEPRTLTDPMALGLNAGPGDNVEANNYLPIDESNGFIAAVRVTLGATTRQNVCVLPERVTLTAVVTRESVVIWDLRVTVTNRLGGTAAAILDVPRLPDLLLLEEEHMCDKIQYNPEVMEKEQADASYEAAASSTTHSATLSDTADDAFQIKLDKIPDGATAIFGCRFLQGSGLRRRDRVGADGEAPPERIADVSIVPGYTPLDAVGVPFELQVYVGPGLTVIVPEDEVLREDVIKLGREADRAALRYLRGLRDVSPAVSELLQLGPTLLSAGALDSWRRLSWSSPTGLARGTLIRIRLSEPQVDLIAELRKLTIGAPAQKDPAMAAEAALCSAVHAVDTIDGVCFAPEDGSKLASTLVDLTLPLAPLPGLAPTSAPHELYVIVDTSGSTAMRVHSDSLGGQVARLDTSKHLLRAILNALPVHLNALRDQQLINTQPVRVRLWSFDDRTTSLADVMLPADRTEPGDVVEQLQAQLRALRPGGCTNYDSWSAELRACVAVNPASLHSVILVTDGGATSRERFFGEIDAIRKQPGVGFFQVDCLGYGPWLDPSCVSWLARMTGGEALMVASLEGRAIQTKVLGLLARSVLRAASRLTLRVHGAQLLALRNGSDAAAPPPEWAHESAALGGLSSQGVMEGDPTFTVRALPGTRLKMILLHPSGALGAVANPPTPRNPNDVSGLDKLIKGNSKSGARPSVSLTLGDGRMTYSFPLGEKACIVTAAGTADAAVAPTGPEDLASAAARRRAATSSGPPEPADDWELVETAPPSPSRRGHSSRGESRGAPKAVPVLSDGDRAVASLRAKLALKPTQQALRHLPLLEPAYHPAGTVAMPEVCTAKRALVTLRTSLLGQLVAPSVTKGCAVAQLESGLAPVPEDCRPKPSALRAAFSAYRLTFDEAHKARAALDQQQQQQQQQASNGGSSYRGGSLFGGPCFGSVGGAATTLSFGGGDPQNYNGTVGASSRGGFAPSCAFGPAPLGSTAAFRAAPPSPSASPAFGAPPQLSPAVGERLYSSHEASSRRPPPASPAPSPVSFGAAPIGAVPFGAAGQGPRAPYAPFGATSASPAVIGFAPPSPSCTPFSPAHLASTSSPPHQVAVLSAAPAAAPAAGGGLFSAPAAAPAVGAPPPWAAPVPTPFGFRYRPTGRFSSPVDEDDADAAEHLTSPPTMSRWLRESLGGVYAASVAALDEAAPAPAQPWRPITIGAAPLAKATKVLVRLTRASLEETLVILVARVRSTLDAQSIAMLAARPPVNFGSPFGRGGPFGRTHEDRQLATPIWSTGNPLKVINSISASQPALGTGAAAAIGGEAPTSGSSAQSAALLPAVPCLRAHPMAKMVGRTPAGYQSTSCDQCQRTSLERSAPFFFHCASCRYDLCERCAATKIGVSVSALSAPPAPPSAAHSPAMQLPIVPLTLRLFEGIRVLGLGGAADGPAADFATWVSARAASAEAAQEAAASAADLKAHIAPVLALATVHLGLGAVAGGLDVTPALVWPWHTPPAAVPVVTGQPTPASRTATAPSAPAESSMGVVLGITIRSVHDPAYAAAVTERSAQTPLFSPAVRRDLYAIVLNPSAPGAPAADPSGYGVAFIGKPSVLGGALDTLAYVDRAALPALLSEWTLFEDSVLLESLQQIGLTTAPALATTLAFEQYLAATARAAWTTDTVQRLSCEFLVAFAVEMTPRLDINHRVRSCKLSAADVATLSTAPFASFVDQGMLRTFQTMP